MPFRAEVQRRAEYLERAMKEGVAPLWALIGVAITVIGGSVTLAVIWGVKHLIWTLVIVLLVLLAVLAEGSYRAATHRDTKHAERVAELEGERDAKAKELEAARQATSVAPTGVHRAEWKGVCNESGEFPNSKALTFGFDHIHEHPGAYLALNPRRCTIATPDGVTVSATRPNRYFQYPQEFENAPPVCPGLYRFKLEGQLASGEWAFITEGEHEVRAPLTVEIVDSRFENWRHIALIVALRVKITNATEAMMRLSGFGFTHDPDGLPGLSTTLSGDENLELDRELHGRRDRQYYGLPLRTHATVPADESVTGWVVEALPRRAAGGAPGCTIVIRDVLGNEYRATLPKREPQTFG
jgi:hypothetical protein